MDLVIDTDQMIFVNNEEAGLDTLVYENFSVEWKTDEYGVARIDNNTYNDSQESDSDDASVLAEQDANSTESDNTVARTSEQMMNQVLDELHDDLLKKLKHLLCLKTNCRKMNCQKMIYRKIYRKKTHQKYSYSNCKR